LNGGATTTPEGTVYMVWELVHKSGQAQGPQDVAVTKSTDHGVTWTLSYVDTGLPPGPDCALCGWDFLGTGAAIATDQSGNVYVSHQGCALPYGDYITVVLDPKGNVQFAWGEGPTYSGPGNTLYSHG